MGWFGKRRSSVFPDVFKMDKALRQLDRDLFGRYGFFTVSYKIGRTLYNDYKRTNVTVRASSSVNTNTPSKRKSSTTKQAKPQYLKKSAFKAEINELTEKIVKGEDPIKQYKRLAQIHCLTGNLAYEIVAWLGCVKTLLASHNLTSLYDDIVYKFNHAQLMPPDSVCEDDEVNAEYRYYMQRADSANKKLYAKYAYRR